MKKLVYFVIAISLIFPSIVLATDSCRCQGNLIQVGDHKSKVQEYCGSPDLKETTGEKVYVNEAETEKKTMYIKEWTYKKYQENLIITMEGSKVVDIHTESLN